MQHTTFEYEGAFSFGESKRSEWFMLENKDIPGPGTHPDQMYKTNPNWSIGKEKKKASFIPQHTKNNAPVGKYSPKVDLVFSSSSKYGVGTSNRPDKLNNTTRDVNVNPSDKLTKQSSNVITFGYSQAMNYETQVPAPNSYDQRLPETRRSFNRSQNYFSSADRPPPYGQEAKNPYVGRYNLDFHDTQIKVQFGNPKGPDKANGSSEDIKNRPLNRPQIDVNPDSVGKYYNISGSTYARGDGYSLAGRLPLTFMHDLSFVKNDNPDPSHYNPKLLDSKAAIFTSKSHRSNLPIRQHLQNPSPVSYKIPADKLNKGVLIGTSERPELKVPDGPGPTKYNAKSTLNNVLGKMAWKCPKPKRFLTPSPQDYQLNRSLVQRRPQEGIVLHSDRIDFSVSDTKDIGPGAYNIHGVLEKSLGKIGTSDRFRTKNDNPGPGQYQIPSTLGRLPNYYKNIKRKISERGQTKIIKYDPKSMISSPKKKNGESNMLDDDRNGKYNKSQEFQ